MIYLVVVSLVCFSVCNHSYTYRCNWYENFIMKCFFPHKIHRYWGNWSNSLLESILYVLGALKNDTDMTLRSNSHQLCAFCLVECYMNDDVTVKKCKEHSRDTFVNLSLFSSAKCLPPHTLAAESTPNHISGHMQWLLHWYPENTLNHISGHMQQFSHWYPKLHLCDSPFSFPLVPQNLFIIHYDLGLYTSLKH